jgi:hypothetical protein
MITNDEKTKRIIKALNGSAIQLKEDEEIYADNIKAVNIPYCKAVSLPDDIDNVDLDHMYIKNMSPCHITVELTYFSQETLDLIETYFIKKRMTPVKSFDAEKNVISYYFNATKRKQNNIMLGLSKILRGE